MDLFGTRAMITGDEVVALSIRRIMLAHSPVLQGLSDWTVIAEEVESGATMVVRASSEDEMGQMLGLGFFGLMTIRAHHQHYHLTIATGQSLH